MLIERPGSAVRWARAFIFPALGQGSRAVDATAGNGYDTLFLAGCVGSGGRVYSLDIQEEALENTRQRVSEAGLSGRVIIIPGGHQDMEKLVEEPVDAVMFNLGYLPGSDRSVITRPDTTREALRAAIGILRPGGRISVVAYTGHPGSREESGEVSSLLAALDLREYSVQKLLFWNSRGDSPELYFVTRSGGKND